MYKNLESVTFFMLIDELFHQNNLNFYLILNIFALNILHVFPTGKKI